MKIIALEISPKLPNIDSVSTVKIK